MPEVDIYPVGVLADWLRFLRHRKLSVTEDRRKQSWWALRISILRGLGLGRYAYLGNSWRRRKQYFHGYHAELLHDQPWQQRAGVGWTRGIARRSLLRQMP